MTKNRFLFVDSQLRHLWTVTAQHVAKVCALPTMSDLDYIMRVQDGEPEPISVKEENQDDGGDHAMATARHAQDNGGDQTHDAISGDKRSERKRKRAEHDADNDPAAASAASAKKERKKGKRQKGKGDTAGAGEGENEEGHKQGQGHEAEKKEIPAATLTYFQSIIDTIDQIPDEQGKQRCFTRMTHTAHDP
jgi:hypothetical protein